MLVDLAGAAEVAGAWSSVASIGASATPLLAIDVRDGSRAGVDVDRLDRLTSGLWGAPWVSIACVGPDLAPSLIDVVDACDIVIGEGSGREGAIDVDDVEAEVAFLEQRVSASPAASVALVQLLRLTHHGSVESALHGESLTYGLLQTGDVFQAWLADRRARTGSQTTASEPDRVVRVERVGGRLDITLDRVHRRNALNIAMRDQLTEALELLDADRTLDGAVLRGTGPNFSAGGDLDEFGTTPSPAVGHRVRTVRSLPRLMHHVRDRIRVHLHGTCVGAGIELPAFAHAVLAHPDTTFRLPEIGFGLVPGAGGTVSITRRCGRYRTAWWAIRGEPIDATTALAWNLIDRIDPA